MMYIKITKKELEAIKKVQEVYEDCQFLRSELHNHELKDCVCRLGEKVEDLLKRNKIEVYQESVCM